MSCKCAKYDGSTGRYECSVSGDGCMFIIPDSKKCAEVYEEGPEAHKDEKCENCQGLKMIDGKRYCTSTWGRAMMDVELFGDIKHMDVVPIDEECICCGGFRKIVE